MVDNLKDETEFEQEGAPGYKLFHWTHPKAWGDQNYFLFSVHVKGIELIKSKVSEDVLELSSRLLASSLL